MAVKLLLEREGHYPLTDTDRVGCRVMDQLLVSARWVEEEAGRGARESWTGIRSKARWDLDFDNTMKAVRKTHPELFGDAGELET